MGVAVTHVENGRALPKGTFLHLQFATLRTLARLCFVDAHEPLEFMLAGFALEFVDRHG
jgi:hypothetical protein